MSPHLFNVSTKDMLDSTERRRRQSPEEILGRVEMGSTEIWADLGCGIGYFTLPLAGRVSRVIALDAQLEMLETLFLRASEDRVENIDPVLATMPPLPLCDESIDSVLLVNVLHEVEEREVLVREIHRVLKPGGRVIVVDFQKRPSQCGPPVEERISYQEAMALFDSFQPVMNWQLEEYYQLELRL